MTDRIPLDDLTSDQLDTLYDRLDAYERWATTAEAAVDSVRALHQPAPGGGGGLSFNSGARCQECDTSYRCTTIRTLDQAQQPTTAEPPSHLPGGGNAEDCPACRPQIDKTVLYPWICPGPPQQQPAT